MGKLGPRISESAEKWLTENFETKNAGGEFVLEAFPALYKRGLAELRGKFSGNELALLVDTFNSTMIYPPHVGQSVELCAADSMDLDGTDAKWGVEREVFLEKLAALTFFEKACLEIFVKSFWSSPTTGGALKNPGALEAWVEQIAASPVEVTHEMG